LSIGIYACSDDETSEKATDTNTDTEAIAFQNNEELNKFLKDASSEVTEIGSVTFKATNDTQNAIAGSVITFSAIVTDKNTGIAEPYDQVHVTPNDAVVILENENSVAIKEDESTPSFVSIEVYFNGIKKDFSYNIVFQDASPGNVLILNNRYTKELPSDFAPSALMKSNGNNIGTEAGESLERMVSDAKAEGVGFYLVSGYRSFELQTSLYERSIARNGPDQKSSAPPGHSEHQTGYAADLSCNSEGGSLEESFAGTDAYKWLETHAADYGFIIRYTRRNIAQTGYIYEPWHYRYIGVAMAHKYLSEGWNSLDEFLSIPR
jgi:D-alanyl-D-alanine carboxypeptidase